MVDEEQQQEKFHQKPLWPIRRMNPTIIQVDPQSKCMACPSTRKEFCQQRIHNASNEVLGVEILAREWQHIDDVNSPNHCRHGLSAPIA
jgi:hypothetical protein